MKLPFTADEFFEVFSRYNQAVWPAQPVMLVVGVLAVALVFWRPGPSSRVISAILAMLWAWMAVAYHLLFFATINPAARVFALVFLVQAVLFAALGVVRRRLTFGGVSTARAITGWVLVVYGLVVYPALGWVAGHRYPAVPTLGVPCPTTILTLGLILFLRPPFPRAIVVIPVLWSGIGSTAAFSLGVPQDLGLLAAGVVVLAACMLPQRAPNAAT